MPRDKNLRKKKYNYLCERDGQRCQICGRTSPEVYLEVDHRDGNEENDGDDNLWLLCRSDHRKKHPRGKQKKGEVTVKRRVVSMETFNEVMETSGMSPEMRQNKRAEPLFRHWLYKRMKEKGIMTVQQVVNSGAEIAGCSTYAIRTNYLLKVSSEEGLYQIFYDEEKGKNMIQFRRASDIGILADAVDFEVMDESKDE
jgi:hypothetical protein